MYPFVTGDLANRFIAKIGQTGNYCSHRVVIDVRGQSDRVGSVQLMRRHVIQSVRLGYRSGGAAIYISELNLVVAGIGQQAADHCAYFSSPEYEYAMHLPAPVVTTCLPGRGVCENPAAAGQQEPHCANRICDFP
ncbi:hypothetical protein MnTg04_00789 [bacterium MnTg04]|nr:hypothetical protein MnTg04_00789 [bacterium MnTg04]